MKYSFSDILLIMLVSILTANLIDTVKFVIKAIDETKKRRHPPDRMSAEVIER